MKLYDARGVKNWCTRVNIWIEHMEERKWYVMFKKVYVCMYMHEVYISLHIYAHTHIHIYAHTQFHKYVNIHMHPHTYIYTHSCTSMWTKSRIRIQSNT